MADASHVTTPPKSASDERAKSKQVGALRALWPFVAPYWKLMLAAIAALVGTAIISLTLPMAVRRVVDSFQSENAALLDLYFMAAIGIAGLLALGTALRYALVTRLGRACPSPTFAKRYSTA